MKITYIHHSSFSVEFSGAAVLFDYYAGPLPDFPKEKELFVFASHKHHDHFDLSVLSLAEKYPKIHFVLSRDIRMNQAYLARRQVPEAAWDKIIYMGKHASQVFETESGSLQAETLASTDAGVAFLISCEGRHLYHAGDLNWWTWKGETEEEYRDMTSRFQNEIGRIEGRHFDAAFVPLDPRQEERYALGFDYFMRHTDTDAVFPMHFWRDYSVTEKLLGEDVSAPYRDRIMRIEREGQEFWLP